MSPQKRSAKPILRILHTNDLHGTLSDAGVATLKSLRTPETLHLDSGDCIKAGNLAVPLRPEVCWPRLATAGCDLGTIGNRETHIRSAVFQAKLAGVQHPLLVANIRRRDGQVLDLPFQRTVVREFAGLRLGFFGVMVPMVTERMATAPLSEYLWDAPLTVAEQVVEELAPSVDLIVALTHIGFRQDVALAQRCPGISAIFGGHSHTILEQPHLENGVAIMQGGSHSRYVGMYDFDGKNWSGNLVPLQS